MIARVHITHIPWDEGNACVIQGVMPSDPGFTPGRWWIRFDSIDVQEAAAYAFEILRQGTEKELKEGR